LTLGVIFMAPPWREPCSLARPAEVNMADTVELDDIDLPLPGSTFVVRVHQAASGEVSGTLERVRTGEKRRFRGLDGLVALMAQMMEERGDHASPVGSA
jgi:hypothetical protein